MSEIIKSKEKQCPQRTLTQNAALHLFFQLVADTLNGAGLDMRRTLRQDIDIPWTKETVKEYIWRPIQNAQLGKKSTTQLTTAEVGRVYDTLNRFMGEKLGITESFPSIDQIMRLER